MLNGSYPVCTNREVISLRECLYPFPCDGEKLTYLSPFTTPRLSVRFILQSINGCRYTILSFFCVLRHACHLGIPSRFARSEATVQEGNQSMERNLRTRTLN